MSKPTVAILGASADRSKFGNKSLRAHLAAGYDVYPVNLKGGEIEGLRVYQRLADIPVELDRVSSYLPPAIGLLTLNELAAKGCDELWLNPVGGTPELAQRAQALGIHTVNGCSIVDLGMSPNQFGD